MSIQWQEIFGYLGSVTVSIYIYPTNIIYFYEILKKKR